MNRAGFALPAALWLTATMALTMAVLAADVGVEIAASHNRSGLLRAAWARDACVQLALASLDDLLPDAEPLDSVDMGPPVWCRASIRVAEGRVNLNTADSTLLAAAIGADSLAEIVLRRRAVHPLEDSRELRLVGAMSEDAVARAVAYTTTFGSGRLSLNSAPSEVLERLPGMTQPAVAALEAARARGIQFDTPDAFLAVLPASAREHLLTRYDEWLSAASFDEGLLVVTASGHVFGARSLGSTGVVLVRRGSGGARVVGRRPG